LNWPYEKRGHGLALGLVISSAVTKLFEVREFVIALLNKFLDLLEVFDVPVI